MKVGVAGISVALLAFAASIGSLAAQEAAAPSPSIWSGVYTSDQAERGRAIYGNHCLLCHGAKLTDSLNAPPLAGDEFLANWKGESLGALFEKMSTLMPADAPGTLTKQQYADVLAYMLEGDKAPAGTAELKGDVETLAQIRIDAKPGG